MFLRVESTQISSTSGTRVITDDNIGLERHVGQGNICSVIDISSTPEVRTLAKWKVSAGK